MSRRTLDQSERVLWEQVIRTVRPLAREPIADDVQRAPPSLFSLPYSAAAQSRARTTLVPARSSLGSQGTLDGSWDRRLTRGVVVPDRIVDLHGHNLVRAYDHLDRALEEAIANQERVLLLVTGHAPRGEPTNRRGAIRAAVGDWLAASRHAQHIAAVRNAHSRHGGAGALYIVLKRGRWART